MNKSFCITGSLIGGTRPDIEALIKELGGTVKTSVTKSLDYLIVGADPGRSKQEAACKYGVTTISEEQLYALLGIEMPKPKLNMLQINGELDD